MLCSGLEGRIGMVGDGQRGCAPIAYRDFNVCGKGGVEGRMIVEIWVENISSRCFRGISKVGREVGNPISQPPSFPKTTKQELRIKVHRNVLPVWILLGVLAILRPRARWARDWCAMP